MKCPHCKKEVSLFPRKTLDRIQGILLSLDIGLLIGAAFGKYGMFIVGLSSVVAGTFYGYVFLSKVKLAVNHILGRLKSKFGEEVRYINYGNRSDVIRKAKTKKEIE